MSIVEASIIIRTYNEENHIGKLLEGISEQDYKNYEIIIVDSGSTDATLGIASNYSVKIIKIKPADFSFGYSLNKGCEIAKGDIIILASAHVYPYYKDWLSELIKPFKDPEVGLVYGKQRGNEITKYSEHQIFKKWFGEEKDYDQKSPFCNNANAAIRKEIWVQNRYDESLTGLEDLDWAKKIMGLGYKIAYNPKALIIHVHNEKPISIRNRYRREAIALKQIYPEQHFLLFDFLKLFLGNSFSDFIHALKDGVLIKELSSILSFRFNQFWGTYKGFNQDSKVTMDLKQKFYYPKRLRIKSKYLPENQQEPIDYSSISHFDSKRIRDEVL